MLMHWLILPHCVLEFGVWSLLCDVFLGVLSTCSSFAFNLLSEDERAGRDVIKLEVILRLKTKRNDWLLADTCLQAANHCTLF